MSASRVITSSKQRLVSTSAEVSSGTVILLTTQCAKMGGLLPMEHDLVSVQYDMILQLA